MRILIINQHSANHGDESACMALLRSLDKKGYNDVTISYNMSHNMSEKCKFRYKEVRNLSPIKFNYFSYKAINLYYKYSNVLTRLICLFDKELRKEYFAIRNADLIINAPGGANLGLYKDQRYLWRLLIAKRLKKKYAIYSTSIGPFDKNDKKYISRAREVLKGAFFLSLRDQKSYEYAEKFMVPYVKSIDTAFLETQSDIQLPDELNSLIPEKYLIIVPNQLYNWHPSFKGIISNEEIDAFYSKLIDRFSSTGQYVVLLPQLFEQGDKNDEDYFIKLKDNKKNVIVISTQYSSDIQQKIIEKADFIIGARYHTIIFAINNNTPFYCLSYEHKMSDMLKLLGLEEYSFEIKNAFEQPEICIETIMEIFNKRNTIQDKIDLAKVKAKKLASGCFEKFCAYI